MMGYDARKSEDVLIVSQIETGAQTPSYLDEVEVRESKAGTGGRVRCGIRQMDEELFHLRR